MSVRPYINCRELIDFIAEYLDGTLPTREREDFERHLAVCPSCRAYLATYKTTLRLGKTAYDEDVIEDAPEDLIQAILKVQRGGRE